MRSLVIAFWFPLLLSGACVEDTSPGGAAGTSGSPTTTAVGDTGEETSSIGASESSAASESTGSDVEEDGVALFAGLCAPCHGAEGEGTALGYELRHPDREHSTWVVRNGRPGVEFENSVMIALPPTVVSDAQLEEIWDWLDAFEQPTTGEGLYVDYCGNCHGDDAAGGAVGKDIRDKELGDIQEKVRRGEGLGSVGARARYMPARGTSALTDAEVQAIADYIAAD
jgi:mono/diheme cytochrome c family protein